MIGWLIEVLTYGAIGALIGACAWNHYNETARTCVTHHEWRKAPHEQQPEPMMAQAVSGVERWLM
jgi:hypothetical protein